MIRLRNIAWLVLPLLIMVGCKNDNKNVLTSTTVELIGNVIDGRTLRAIPNVLISTVEFTETTHTDSNGHYQMVITTGDSFHTPLHIIAIADGYIRDTVFVQVFSGQTINVPRIAMSNFSDHPDTTATGPSGPPATIFYVGANDTSIGVRETGIDESAILTYEVRDTRGVAIDLDHRATVHFRIDGSTGGGEYLGNDTAVTDGNGRAQVSIIAGIRPGTIEIVAIVHDTIFARPARISIHTGPPDSLHTTIGFHHINFPGLNWVGRVDSVVALIGDRYSNPVPIATQCYFYTDHGVIQPQGYTNFDGLTTVPLFSGNPYPSDPVTERGWSDVHTQTTDWHGISYRYTGQLLWTGVVTNLDITPPTFDIPNNGSQTFQVYISDYFNHPLSSGTVYQVVASSGTLSGDVLLTYPDTQTGWTNFTFALSDADTTPRLTTVTVSVSVDGDNGHMSHTINGIMH